MFAHSETSAWLPASSPWTPLFIGSFYLILVQPTFRKLESSHAVDRTTFSLSEYPDQEQARTEQPLPQQQVSAGPRVAPPSAAEGTVGRDSMQPVLHLLISFV